MAAAVGADIHADLIVLLAIVALITATLAPADASVAAKIRAVPLDGAQPFSALEPAVLLDELVAASRYRRATSPP